jgi:hypothetical protein
MEHIKFDLLVIHRDSEHGSPFHKRHKASIKICPFLIRDTEIKSKRLGQFISDKMKTGNR